MILSPLQGTRLCAGQQLAPQLGQRRHVTSDSLLPPRVAQRPRSQCVCVCVGAGGVLLAKRHDLNIRVMDSRLLNVHDFTPAWNKQRRTTS